eukprot:COSAG06_NODE_39227_length_415_cov_0.610759_1_plen_58_part_10
MKQADVGSDLDAAILALTREMVDAFDPSAHSLHSRTHSLNHSLTHSRTYSRTHPLTHC